MKRIATLIILFSLVSVVVMGQDIDLQMAVATQALNHNMLMELGMTEAEAGEVLALQEQFRQIKEQTNLELNIIKAQIAQKLYYPDANSNEVNPCWRKQATCVWNRKRHRFRHICRFASRSARKTGPNSCCVPERHSEADNRLKTIHGTIPAAAAARAAPSPQDLIIVDTSPASPGR